MINYQALVWDLAEMLWRLEFRPYPPLGAFKDADNIQQEVFLAEAARLAGLLTQSTWIKGD